MSELNVSNSELVTLVKIGRRNNNGDERKMPDSLRTMFDKLKMAVYSDYQTYETEDESCKPPGVIARLVDIYSLTYDEIEWLIAEAEKEDVPLSLEVVGIIQRAARMGGKVSSIAHLVDKPSYKVQEVIDSMQDDCDCPICVARRKLERGEELSSDERTNLIMAMLKVVHEQGDD